ncbi:hypothetical protein H9Y04_01040 [Streptomyces sp. TRM66268-LWL]|uniref:Lipoprotein n=1 Tax=Streptomyces polyasparticus TaxID=2767826 RepID=A0ABR7S6P7_9ACTN|nr:hypothetical protein [Streptomyces polyasparticus]MBC9711157.1 hypothetical protein [Streptomyces polyasparticus]
MRLYGKSLAAVGIVGLALTGCSSGGGEQSFDGKSAGTIADEATAAMKSAKSFRLVTDGEQRGQRTKVEMDVAASGTCRTKMDLPMVGVVESVTVDGASYSKGGPDFMKMALGGEAAAKAAQGRWVKSPDKAADTTCRIESLFTPDGLKGATRGADSTVDGRRTATLTKSEQNNKVTVHVAAEGKPYVLRIETDGPAKNTATFSSFDEPIVVKAPPASEVVQGKKMGSS